MTGQEFCYWLQGYFEVSGPDAVLTKEQVSVVKDHLQLVFKKETPVRGLEPWAQGIGQAAQGQQICSQDLGLKAIC